MNIDYKEKYLKYKNKYLQIKKIYGGKNIIKGGTIIFDNNLDGFKSIRGDSNEEAELWNILYRNNVAMLNIPDEWDGWDGEKHFNILRNRGLKLKREYYQEIIANLPNIMNNFIENEQHEDFEECLNLIKQIVNKRQAGVLRHEYNDSQDPKHDRILEKWRGVLETINPSVSCSESEKDKTPICRYFENGYCREGENCHFQHGEKLVYAEDKPVKEEYVPVRCSESEKDKTPICRYFERGYCREGENCRFQHGEKSIYKKYNVPVQEVIVEEYTISPSASSSPPPLPPPSRGFAQKPESRGFGVPYMPPGHGFAQKPESRGFGVPYAPPLSSYQESQESKNYPQQNIKTSAKKCRNWTTTGHCCYGDRCHFSHQ